MVVFKEQYFCSHLVSRKVDGRVQIFLKNGKNFQLTLIRHASYNIQAGFSEIESFVNHFKTF